MIEIPRIEDLSLLVPEDIAAYLMAQGWQRESGITSTSEVWVQNRVTATARHWNTTVDELVLPRVLDVVDYAYRLAQAVGTISFVENRPAESVIRDIITTRSDVVRFKRPSTSADGSIPLTDGVTLVDRALEMLTAAACSAATPRRVVPARRPLNAQEYLRRIRLGQTEKSSYVITVISPLARLNVEEPSLFEAQEDTFPRRVTKTLASGLVALEQVLESVKRDGNFGVFDDVVATGVSANMCEAVARLVRSPDRESAISIRVDWAFSQPLHSAAQVTFEPDAEPYLAEAAKRFRASEPLEGTLLTGVVVRLQRRREQLEGRITVSCVVDGALRQLAVPLGLADYQNAVQAHREQKGVMFRADVVKDRRHYLATNVREFRVL